MIVECDCCSKTVKMIKSCYENKMKVQKHIFCKRRCYEKSKTLFALEKKSCTYCKKEIIRLRSQFKKKVQFCDRNCAMRYRRKEAEKYREMICPICRKKRIAHSPTDFATRKSHICQECDRKYFSQERLKLMRKRKIELAEFKIFNCDWCGKKISLSKKHKENYNKHFCSKDCQQEWNSRTRIKVECKNCRKQIFKSPSSVKICKMNFCSHKCHYDYVREPPKTLKCSNCNKTFTMKRSYYRQKIKYKATSLFHCSRECLHELQKKNSLPHYYSRALRALKISNEYAKENNLLELVELKSLHLKFKEEIRYAKSKEYQ